LNLKLNELVCLETRCDRRLTWCAGRPYPSLDVDRLGRAVADLSARWYYSNMMVKRIVANFATGDVSKARRFYADILGLEVAMDLGWIVTFTSPAQMAPQLSVATEGGSGTPVPDISIEVDEPQ
jgi:hypothetical protein